MGVTYKQIAEYIETGKTDEEAMTKIELLKGFAKGWFGNSNSIRFMLKFQHKEDLRNQLIKLWLNQKKNGMRQRKLTLD